MAQRECTVEAGSFLLGYLLGLPCMAFAPTAERPLDMLTGGEEGVGGPANAGTPPRIIDRLLIWAMAPVAVKTSSVRLRRDTCVCMLCFSHSAYEGLLS